MEVYVKSYHRKDFDDPLTISNTLEMEIVDWIEG